MVEPSQALSVKLEHSSAEALLLHVEHGGGKTDWAALGTLTRALREQAERAARPLAIVFLDLEKPLPPPVWTQPAARTLALGPVRRTAEPRLLVLLAPVPLTSGSSLDKARTAERNKTHALLGQLARHLGDDWPDQLLVLSPGTREAQVRELRGARDKVIGHEVICPAKDTSSPAPGWWVDTFRKATSWFRSVAARERKRHPVEVVVPGSGLRSVCLSQYVGGATVQLSMAPGQQPLSGPLLHVYFQFRDGRRADELEPWLDGGALPALTPARNGARLERVARPPDAEDIIERCRHATGTERVEAVVKFERKHVLERRQNRAQHIAKHEKHETHWPAGALDELTGLALSGGGIRASTVSVGLLRGLQDARALETFDYASSVSGGSYANGYLQVMTSPPVLAQLDVEFGKENLFARAFDDQSIAALLQSGRYLAMGTGPRGLFNVLRFLTSYLTALLLHWLWIVSLVTTLGLVCRCFGEWLRPLAGGLGALAILLLTVRSIALRDYSRINRRRSRNFDDLVNRIETFTWLLLAATCSALVLSRVPSWFAGLARHIFFAAQDLPLKSPLWTVAAVALLVFAHFRFDRTNNPRTDARRSWAAFVAGLAAVAGGGWQLASVLARECACDPVQTLDQFLQLETWSERRWLGVMSLVTLGMTLITSPNNTSLYRYYSARLADSFLRGVDRKAPSKDKHEPAANEDKDSADARLLRDQKSGQKAVYLRDLTEPGNLGPYPLFNGCVNLMGADDAKFVGLRTADYYLMAPHHCGAKLTGYARTCDKGQYGWLTLATAITVSGAAISPFQGRTMPSAVSIALWLLNLRTDVWLPNPAHPRRGLWRRLVGDAAVLWGPLQQIAALFGQLNTRSRFLNVADGAFIDNLGLYELLRRRCRTIVALDATLDPTYDFCELRNLILRARQELGIEFSFDEPPEAAIKPKTTDGGSDKSVVSALILYPGEPPGVLLYVKSALSKLVPEAGAQDLTGKKASDVSLAYRTYYPEFPQETTGDQFFDAVQWDAYYALGRTLAAELLAHPAWIKALGQRAP